MPKRSRRSRSRRAGKSRPNTGHSSRPPNIRPSSRRSSKSKGRKKSHSPRRYGSAEQVQRVETSNYSKPATYIMCTRYQDAEPIKAPFVETSSALEVSTENPFEYDKTSRGYQRESLLNLGMIATNKVEVVNDSVLRIKNVLFPKKTRLTEQDELAIVEIKLNIKKIVFVDDDEDKQEEAINELRKLEPFVEEYEIKNLATKTDPNVTYVSWTDEFKTHLKTLVQTTETDDVFVITVKETPSLKRLKKLLNVGKVTANLSNKHLYVPFETGNAKYYIPWHFRDPSQMFQYCLHFYVKPGVPQEVESSIEGHAKIPEGTVFEYMGTQPIALYSWFDKGEAHVYEQIIRTT